MMTWELTEWVYLSNAENPETSKDILGNTTSIDTTIADIET
jgi:hypothetical protein